MSSSKVEKIIEHFKFEVLPVEGTLYKSTYRSEENMPNGGPVGTAILGLYCNDPVSVSCFHKLPYPETWHSYSGDPFELVLLYEDGTHERILMGTDFENGQNIQYTVQANVWQAGSLLAGGEYAIYGCTMAPGFSANGFEAAVAEELIEKYPDLEEDILRLSVNEGKTRMSEDTL
ncbi:MAG: cupin domain-containing protein [Oscillospiraceae bacterium]